MGGDALSDGASVDQGALFGIGESGPDDTATAHFRRSCQGPGKQGQDHPTSADQHLQTEPRASNKKRAASAR